MKNIWDKKKIWVFIEILGQKKIRSKKIRDKKMLVQKYFCVKLNIWYKKNWPRKMFGPKIVILKKSGSKKIVGPKLIFLKKMFLGD